MASILPICRGASNYLPAGYEPVKNNIDSMMLYQL